MMIKIKNSLCVIYKLRFEAPAFIKSEKIEFLHDFLNLYNPICFFPHDCTELLLSHKQVIQRKTVGKRSTVFVWIAVRLDASLDSNSWRWSSLR
jgi:hypothetical protein